MPTVHNFVKMLKLYEKKNTNEIVTHTFCFHEIWEIVYAKNWFKEQCCKEHSQPFYVFFSQLNVF